MSRADALAKAPVGRLVLSFSLPSIVGMMANGLSIVLDRIFVGRGVGPDALAGVAILFPLILFAQSFAMLIGHGAASVLSLRLGEGKRHEAETTVGTATALACLLGAFTVLVVGVFMRPLLVFFGGSGVVLAHAVRFTTFLLPGLFLQVLSFTLNNMIRAQGDPVTALVTMLVSVVVNVVLNPIFIFGLGLGVAGSALATDLANAFVVTWLFWLYLRPARAIRLRRDTFRLDHVAVGDIARAGSASWFMQFASGATVLLATKLVASQAGDVGITVLGIGSSLITILLMPIIGVRQGVQPIIGYNYGAGAYGRARSAVGIALTATVVLSTVAYAIFFAFSTEVVGLFVRGAPAVVALGVSGLRGFLASTPFIGIAVVGSVYFQAVGKGIWALAITLVRQLIVLVPLYFILPRYFGIQGLWFAGPVADLASAVLAVALLWPEMRRLSRLEQNRGRVETGEERGGEGADVEVSRESVGEGMVVRGQE